MRRLLEDSVPHVYRFALRLTGDPHQAEDLTQDVMLRALQKLDLLRDPDSARVWLLRITVNLWRDSMRRRKRTPRLQDVSLCDPAGDGATPPASAIHKEELQRALSVLDALPARQRDVVYLRVCEGMDLKDIADVLSISYTAVKANLSAGRKQMRDKLRDVYQASDSIAERPG